MIQHSCGCKINSQLCPNSGKMQLVHLLIFSLAIIATSSVANGQTYRNPIFNTPTPDPFVYLHSDGFYYWAISTGAGIDVMRTRTLTNWNNAERSRVFDAAPPYGALWAPELHFIQGNWYIYFALETDGQNINHRNYVIRALDSNNALGGYSPMLK